MAEPLYDRQKSVFVEAQGLSGTERADFLAQACGADHELRARVERLLDVHDGGGGILADSMQAGAEAASIPERIGEYEVAGVLGVGGMGVVYRAWQASPSRAVAVKVLHPSGALTREALARFRREAEVLGRLRHPGIVQIHEAGTWRSDHGEQHFLVMELVEGLPLTDYCAAHALEIAARLRLMVQVCRAVHHAHEMGVVHRDLKPANILVTAQGEPKVLDFGVAKLGDGAAAGTIRTGMGHLLGTIAYMSPEQVAGDAAALDLRSDVYALGVITYELVAGVLPHDLSGVSLSEAARILVETDPPPLGAVARAFRGDLATIVAKALEKDPARRYWSTADLADDLERFLGNEPIAARPPSTVYVLRKLARRHRELVAGLGVAMAVLVAATAISIALAVEASRQRDRVLVQVEQLQAVEDLQQGMLFATEPAAYLEFLEKAATDVGSRYAHRPFAEGAARKVLAGYFWRAGRFPEWRAQLDAAASLASRLGPEHPIVLRALLSTGDGLSTLYRFGEAEALLRGACERCEETFGATDAETLHCLATWLYCLYEQRHWEAALPLAREAAERARVALPADDQVRAAIERTLAYLAVQRGEAHAGIAQLRESVAAVISKHGPPHIRVHQAEARLATALREAGQYDEALELGRRSVDLNRRQKGADHPDLAVSEYELALTLVRAGRPAQALALLEHSSAIFAAADGPDQPAALCSQRLLAEALLDGGELARAEPLAAAVLAACERAPTPERTLMADAQHLLGRIRLAEGRLAEAEPLLAAALDGARAWDADHPQTIRYRRDQARCLRDLGRYEEAEASLLACHELVTRWPGVKPGRAQEIAGELAQLYTAWGRGDLAASWQRRAQ